MRNQAKNPDSSQAKNPDTARPRTRQQPGQEPGQQPGQEPDSSQAKNPEQPGQEPGQQPGQEPGQQPGQQPNLEQLGQEQSDLLTAAEAAQAAQAALEAAPPLENASDLIEPLAAGLEGQLPPQAQQAFDEAVGELADAIEQALANNAVPSQESAQRRRTRWRKPQRPCHWPSRVPNKWRKVSSPVGNRDNNRDNNLVNRVSSPVGSLDNNPAKASLVSGVSSKLGNWEGAGGKEGQL